MFKLVINKMIVDLVDESYLIKEYLDIIIDWILLMKNLRLKDIFSFVCMINFNDIMFNFFVCEIE